jgi:hypothetical protein
MSDEQFRAILNGTPDWGYHLRNRPDPKPEKRARADQEEWVKIRKRKLEGWPCRVCDDKLAESLHHIVPKGGANRGDDVPENLVPVCGDGTRGCHGLIEARDPWARSLLGQRLTNAERDYVIGKRGAAWLERNYGVRSAA